MIVDVDSAIGFPLSSEYVVSKFAHILPRRKVLLFKVVIAVMV